MLYKIQYSLPFINSRVVTLTSIAVVCDVRDTASLSLFSTLCLLCQLASSPHSYTEHRVWFYLASPTPPSNEKQPTVTRQPWQGPSANPRQLGLFSSSLSELGRAIFSRRSANWQKTVIEEREFHQEQHSLPTRGETEGLPATVTSSSDNTNLVSIGGGGPKSSVSRRPSLTDDVEGILTGPSSLQWHFPL